MRDVKQSHWLTGTESEQETQHDAHRSSHRRRRLPGSERSDPLGGAPRGVAILNGTLAVALGLGLQMWLAGLLFWVIGHTLSVFAAKRDPDFFPVLARHLRQRGYLGC